MKKKKALLVLNGAPCSEELASALSNLCNFTVCADGAYNWYSNMGRSVDVVAGDLDSINIDIPPDTEKIELLDQNYTDFEKVLNLLIESGFAEVHIIGSTGREDDHFLSNLMVLSKRSKEIKMIMYDDNQRIEFVSENKFSFKTKKRKTVISIFGWPKAYFRHSQGLLYPLDRLTLDFNLSGSRNIATGESVDIEKISGAYLIFINENPLTLLEQKME